MPYQKHNEDPKGTEGVFGKNTTEREQEAREERILTRKKHLSPFSEIVDVSYYEGGDRPARAGTPGEGKGEGENYPACGVLMREVGKKPTLNLV